MQFLILILLLWDAHLMKLHLFSKKKEVILPGKRENVFDFKDDIIVKANKKILVDKPATIIHGANNFRIQETTYFTSKAKPVLKLKEKFR